MKVCDRQPLGTPRSWGDKVEKKTRVGEEWVRYKRSVFERLVENALS
jgi:hypothetical protein